MTSRADIIARVRQGLSQAPGTAGGAGRDRSGGRAAVEQRLAERRRHLIPSRVAGKAHEELVATLRRWLEAASGDVIEVAGEADVPAAVAAYLKRHTLPARIRIGADALLAAVPWSGEPTLEVAHGRAVATDTAGVTRALAAVAETGTVVVASGADNPVTLSFLPEANIVVVRRGDVVGPLEDAWARVRLLASSSGALPRTVNMISGPSRSADIGGIPVLGAHGPRRFCLIVMG